MRIRRLELNLRLSVLSLALASMLFGSCGLALDSQAKLARGQEAFDNGEYRAAIIDAKAVLQEEPDNLDARLLLGRASVIVGDSAAAEKELRRAIELGASQAEVLVDLGRSMLQQAKFQEVLTEITTELVDDSDQTRVMRIRADALLQLGRPAEARELFTAVLDLDDSDLDAQVGVANTYIAESNRLQARETLNYILDTEGGFIPALHLSGVLGLQMRDLQRAMHDFGKAAELAKAKGDALNEIPALYGQTDVLFLQDKIDSVRLIFERMQEIAPQDIRTMMTAARLAAADEQWTAAQEMLQQILRRAPEFRAAQFMLGAVHKENGNLGQAEMHLSAVVAASPENASARRLLAETRLELNKAEAAREALQPLTSDTASDVGSLSMAAGASLSLGDVDEAIELLERGVANEPDNVDLKMQLALAYLRDKKLDRAKQLLTSLPDMVGERNEFHRDMLMVMTKLGQGEQEGALEDARALRDKWPGRVDAHGLVGSIEMVTGSLESARASLERGLEIAPDDVSSLRYLAQLEILENDLEAARDRYLVILALQPNDARSMVSLARLAARAENHDEARDWLEKARTADSGSVSARAMLAAHYLSFRDYAAARGVAEEAVQLRPNDPRLQNLLGLAQLYGGNYRDSISSLEKASELDPDEPSYRLNLARAHSARGNNTSAIMALEELSDENLRHLPSGILLASLKADTGDLDSAIRISNRLRELHPNDARPWALQAELLAKQGNPAAAADAYDVGLGIEMIDRFAVRAYQMRQRAGLADQVEPLVKYLETRPLDSNIRIYLAQAYKNLDETADAIAQLEQVLAQHPDNYVAANNLAWNYFEAGDDRAEALARRAFELRPDSDAVADTLGWILTKNGNLDEGIPVLRSAVELSNGRVEIRYHLASALAEAGKKEEAREILKELLQSGEAFEDQEAARALLASLES
jgi:putative PEP-CTERM system TPR-repeat lipoprotein